MTFSRTHDDWIQEGLLHATFMLQVVPSEHGSWGQVEDLPVDVYTCDFEQYNPPQGFPHRDICCIRTNGAWWIIFTKPVFDHLMQLAQDGELAQGFAHAVRMLNERQMGAWYLVRDKAFPGEQALEHMDQRLFEKYGQDYASVKELLEIETSLDLDDLQFDEESFGKEPLEVDTLEDDMVAFEQALDQTVTMPSQRTLVKRLATLLQQWDMAESIKMAGVLALLAAVLLLECPRVYRLSQEIYGPATVDLKASFPQIRWIDRTSDAVMSTPRVSRSLFQAVSHRNPFNVAGSIAEVSVRDLQMPDESGEYRWKIVLDGTGPQDEITAQMSYPSGREMRDLQNTLSGYKSLKFILAFKLFMSWGHNGRFIVICTGLCLGILGLLIKRVLRQVRGIETDMAVRGVAAYSKILESVAQDAHAAENLIRFNQHRRLRMTDREAVESWEKETFDWVERHIDHDTGRTKRKKRNDLLKEKKKTR